MRYLSAVACAAVIAAMAACGGTTYPSSPTSVSVQATGTFSYHNDPDPYEPYPPAYEPPPHSHALAIAPAYGSSAGGTAVTIVGENFAPGATVMFGTAAAIDAVVIDSATITATTPSAADGWVELVVTNPDGMLFSLPGGFTYAAEPALGAVATITITPAGVSPKAILVAAGTRVMFVNNDVRPHDMVSDPHPFHTDCQELNGAGFLTPGASAQTGAFLLGRNCGFHDHNDALNPAWIGRIIAQ